MDLGNNVTLNLYDTLGFSYPISDAFGLKWSNHYSDQGSGYGFLTFSVRRTPNRNYQDIGFGYRVKLIKGVRLYLFDGVIVKNEENTDGTLTISALGWSSILSFDVLNIVLADNRTNRWVGGCVASGSFRPDKFDHSYSWTEVIGEEEVGFDGIQITPRRGVHYVQEDYYYLRYRFEFGETAKALTATYKLTLPNNWPASVTIRDGADNALWTSSVSGNGTLNLDLDSLSAGNFVTIVFTITTLGTNTAEDGTVYFRMWDIQVRSTETVPTATDVLKLIATEMEDRFGYSSDQSLIKTITYPLSQAVYDTDLTMDVIAKQACSFGNGNDVPLAWGCAFDGTKRIFLEAQDFTQIYYTVETFDDLSITGDLTQTSQKVYGRYSDVFGRTQRTAVLTAIEEIAQLGGLYKTAVLDLGELTEDQALTAAYLYLAENKNIKVQTDFTIRDYIFGPNNVQIPVEEIMAGKMVQVPIFRARESQLDSTDKRKGFHTFMLTKVEVDWDSRTATLTPAESQSTFDRYLELLARMVNQ